MNDSAAPSLQDAAGQLVLFEKLQPQDGRIRFRKYGPLDIELRVATIPAAGGVEDVVMHILQAGEPIPLARLA